MRADNEAWNEALVERPDITNGRPDVYRAGLEYEFAANGRHFNLPSARTMVARIGVLSLFGLWIIDRTLRYQILLV